MTSAELADVQSLNKDLIAVDIKWISILKGNALQTHMDLETSEHGKEFARLLLFLSSRLNGTASL